VGEIIGMEQKITEKRRIYSHILVLCRIHLMFSAEISQICMCLAGKLTLKIPWKNLYTQPTVVQLDGLYVVVVPNTSMFIGCCQLLTPVLSIRVETKAIW